MRFLTGFILLLGFSFNSYCQQTIKDTAELPEVVITGLPVATSPENAVSTYQIITRKAAIAQGDITLNDVLAHQLNMQVNTDAILGSTIRLMGLNGADVKILVDGMALNGRENGNIDLGQINLNNIEKIEVVRGPMSVIYGTDALGGVINLITIKSAGKELKASANFNYESVGKYNIEGSLSKRFSMKHALRVSGGRNFFYGWKSLDTGAVQRQLLFKPKEQYFANATYLYTSPGLVNVQLSSDFLKEKVTNKGTPYISPYEGYAFDEYYNTIRSQTRLLVNGKLGENGTWSSDNSYSYYCRIRNSYRKDLVTLNQVFNQGSGEQDTSSFNTVNFRSMFADRIGHVSFATGYDVVLEQGHGQDITNETQHIEDYALFLNLAVKTAENRLTAEGGLRGSQNSTYHAPLIPSFSLLYQPAMNVQLRGSYAKGFRAPSLKELYLEFIDNNHHIVGNTSLKAEESNNAQLSASWQIMKTSKTYLQLMASGFYNDVYNQIVLVNTRPYDTSSIDYSYGNILRVRDAIANVRADIDWKGFSGNVGYAFTHFYGQSGYYGAFNTNEISATIQYLFAKPGIMFSVFYKYLGKQPGLIQNVDGSASFGGSVPAYQLVDASLQHSFLNKKIMLTAGVKNIVNVQSISLTGISTPGNTAHTGGEQMNFLPRRLFITLTVNN